MLVEIKTTTTLRLEVTDGQHRKLMTYQARKDVVNLSGFLQVLADKATHQDSSVEIAEVAAAG